MTTTHRGDSWTQSNATFTRVGVVATTCATCGTLTVLLNGKSIGVISLVSPTTKFQQLLTLPLLPLRTGMVSLVVTSPSTHLVQLDGVILSRM